MKIRVRVHSGARVAKTEQRGEDLHVWVSAPPVDGRANESVAKALAERHGLPRSSVRLVSGRTSKAKTFEVDV